MRDYMYSRKGAPPIMVKAHQRGLPNSPRSRPLAPSLGPSPSAAAAYIYIYIYNIYICIYT